LKDLRIVGLKIVGMRNVGMVYSTIDNHKSTIKTGLMIEGMKE
jgi:hypothetical protein